MMGAKVPFQKMHGAGNDFIMVSHQDLVGLQLTTESIARLCDRRLGIGADGLIIVAEPQSAEADFRMIYFNSDGREAEMCGNGARCTVDFAHRAALFKKDCRFDTFSGLLDGAVMEPGLVEVSLPAWKDLKLDLGIDATPWATQHFCNTGVPHLVIPVPDVTEVDVAKWGAFFRYHGQFSPAGTNINWVSPNQEADGFLIRTYERGVEEETLACGTGAAAAAVVLCQLDETSSPVSLRTRSGDLLTVSVNAATSGLRLRGPAVMSFKGEVDING